MRSRPLPFLPAAVTLAALLPACAPGPGTTERVGPPAPAPAGVPLMLDFPDDFPGESVHVEEYITAVRDAVVRAYEDLGFGVDSASHVTVVATPYLRIQGQIYEGEPNSAYLDCGRIGDGRPAVELHADVRFRLYTILSPSDAGETGLETRITGVAGPGGPRGRIACRGTGVLEHEMNRRIVRYLSDSPEGSG